MKIIFIYYIEHKNLELKSLAKYLLIKKENSLIKLINNDFLNNKIIYPCIFSSKYANPEEINIKFLKFENYSDEFCTFIINSAFQESEQCSNEPIDKTNTEKVRDILQLTFNKYLCYIDENNDFYKKDIICLVSEIFFKIIMQHPLNNGNKRLGTFILIYLLYYFGFHFKNTKGEFANYEVNKSRVEKFVCSFSHSNCNKSQISRTHKDAESIKEIYEWIDENICISLNFKKF